MTRGTDYDYAECRDCEWATIGADSIEHAESHAETGHDILVSVRVSTREW